MTTLRINTTRFQQKMADAARAATDAKVAAISVYGGALVENFERIAPRDSNRYIRAWFMAGNRAGVSGKALPALNRSSRHDEHLKKLEAQVDRISKQIERWERGMRGWYDNQPERKKGPWYYKAGREVRKLRKRLGRAYEQLILARGDEFFLFFDAEAYVERKSGRKLSTVRVKIYGGTGRIDVDGSRVRLTLHNLEPHAAILEARFGVVAVASPGARALGDRKASLAYRERIREVVGAAVSAGGGAKTMIGRGRGGVSSIAAE